MMIYTYSIYDVLLQKCLHGASYPTRFDPIPSALVLDVDNFPHLSVFLGVPDPGPFDVRRRERHGRRRHEACHVDAHARPDLGPLGPAPPRPLHRHPGRGVEQVDQVLRGRHEAPQRRHGQGKRREEHEGAPPQTHHAAAFDEVEALEARRNERGGIGCDGSQEAKGKVRVDRHEHVVHTTLERGAVSVQNENLPPAVVPVAREAAPLACVELLGDDGGRPTDNPELPGIGDGTGDEVVRVAAVAPGPHEPVGVFDEFPAAEEHAPAPCEARQRAANREEDDEPKVVRRDAKRAQARVRRRHVERVSRCHEDTAIATIAGAAAAAALASRRREEVVHELDEEGWVDEDVVVQEENEVECIGLIQSGNAGNHVVELLAARGCTAGDDHVHREILAS
mmetsp:Transcript_821/g.1912  ORF Transcript_821/g.1912 Transcript_821/m.1912 type:complete len:395 (+) Transcript_821:554-1738(+)